MRLCFLHGLDSSPEGTKASLLKKHEESIWIPVLPPGVFDRLRLLEQEAHEPVLLMGSSMGGLTALMYAMAHPEMVEGMVLMAPAVQSRQNGIFTDEEKAFLGSVYIPAGIPTIVIAGKQDVVVPLSAIRRVIERSPDNAAITLHEVDDDHDLHRSLNLMWKAVSDIRGRIRG
jgi:pimeloyl-ACP methyl ester carboxylesterase